MQQYGLLKKSSITLFYACIKYGQCSINTKYCSGVLLAWQIIQQLYTKAKKKRNGTEVYKTKKLPQTAVCGS